MGAYEREDKPLQDLEGKDAMWYCYQVSVTDTSTGDKYVFPCKDWVEIGSSPFKRSMGKELELKDVEQSQVSVVRSKCRNEPLKCMTGRLKCMTGAFKCMTGEFKCLTGVFKCMTGEFKYMTGVFRSITGGFKSILLFESQLETVLNSQVFFSDDLPVYVVLIIKSPKSIPNIKNFTLQVLPL